MPPDVPRPTGGASRAVWVTRLRLGGLTNYNVASGVNVTHGDIVEVLRNLTGCAVQVRPNAPTVRFPPISVARLADEFGYVSAPLLGALPDLVERSHVAPRIGG